MVRIGLITSCGSSRHDRLVASTVKFLINSCDASPLEIETEKEMDIPQGTVYIDVVWDGRYIECVASKSGLDQRKADELIALNIPLIVAVADDLDMRHINQVLSSKIKAVLVFDLKEMKLFKAFDNFSEYVGYMLVKNNRKSILVD